MGQIVRTNNAVSLCMTEFRGRVGLCVVVCWCPEREGMAEADPEMLLEWLTMGQGEESRDIQMVALEQLCMLLLMADNVDKCFES